LNPKSWDIFMEHLVEITVYWHQFQRSCWFQV
jgi:hypothetical protein